MTKDTPRLNAFPIFMRVDGGAVVVVGNGDEALAKARLLSQSSAKSPQRLRNPNSCGVRAT